MAHKVDAYMTAGNDAVAHSFSILVAYLYLYNQFFTCLQTMQYLLCSTFQNVMLFHGSLFTIISAAPQSKTPPSSSVLIYLGLKETALRLH